MRIGTKIIASARVAMRIGTKIIASALVVVGAGALLGLAVPLRTARNFTVSCADSATPITASGIDNYSAVYCTNMSSTSIFLGGSNVTTSNAPCISTTAGTCARPDFPWDAELGAGLYCIVASGSATLKCISGK